jgi:ribosome-binding factor A
MVSKMRAQRIADRIFEELSILLVMEVSDPRVENASITDVSVDRELTFANIYVSSLEGSQAAPTIMEGLNHAKGYLRHALAQRIQLRTFPKLRFYWDPVPERADRIDKLLNSLPGFDEQSSSNDEEAIHPNG